MLGLVEQGGEVTPYRLKAMLAASVGNFWSLQHAQLYTEPLRLAAAGLLEESVEPGGRRRRSYRLTRAGRAALRAWVDEPSSELPELRDVGLLKLFFGAEPKPLAEAQLEAHRAKLAGYEERQRNLPPQAPPGPRATLAAGVAHEREWVRYWEEIARASPARSVGGP